MRCLRPVNPVLLALSVLAGPVLAGDLYNKGPVPTGATELPKPAEVSKLGVYPEMIALRGGDDAKQLVLTAALAGDRLQDLSGDVTYTVADPKVVRVTGAGRVVPLANGATEITAAYGDKAVKIPVTAADVDVNLPINFGN